MSRIIGLVMAVVTTACASAPETSNAKYLWIYHRDGGTWQLARLMWNSSDPAAPPAQPPPRDR